MTDDPRDYNHGEILSFVEKTNEAENPERLTGFYVNTTNGTYPGLRTADYTWIRFEDVRNIRRVPVIESVSDFLKDATEEISKALFPTGPGLVHQDRGATMTALSKIIDGLFRIPPEPPQWTTVKVTYSDPIDRSGWDYYTRDLDLTFVGADSDRWMGPKERVSWAALQKMGAVEILPAPKHEED